MCFLIKFSYGPCTRKPFTWKVMLSVLPLFILHDFLFSTDWNDFLLFNPSHRSHPLHLFTSKH